MMKSITANKVNRLSWHYNDFIIKKPQKATMKFWGGQA